MFLARVLRCQSCTLSFQLSTWDFRRCSICRRRFGANPCQATAERSAQLLRSRTIRIAICSAGSNCVVGILPLDLLWFAWVPSRWKTWASSGVRFGFSFATSICNRCAEEITPHWNQAELATIQDWFGDLVLKFRPRTKNCADLYHAPPHVEHGHNRVLGATARIQRLHYTVIDIWAMKGSLVVWGIWGNILPS